MVQPKFIELSSSLNSSPRLSLELLDESNFISICPSPPQLISASGRRNAENHQFEKTLACMKTTEELYQKDKQNPAYQLMQNVQKLAAIRLKGSSDLNEAAGDTDDGRRKPQLQSNDDPSPRPPNCIVLWKELLRLKKQRSAPDREKTGMKKATLKMKIRPVFTTRPPAPLAPPQQQRKNVEQQPPLFSLRKGRLER